VTPEPERGGEGGAPDTGPPPPRFGPPRSAPAAHLLTHPHWYALWTRPRSEKVAAKALALAGVEVVPALVSVERAWSDRTRVVTVPLFPSYIFVRIRLGELGDVLSIHPAAINLVRSRGLPAPVREEEIAAVLHLVAGVTQTGDLPVEVEPLTPGVRVVVTGGPFRGMTGVMVDLRGSTHVVVHLEALKIARAVSVERALLRVVDPS
jgi:transcription antitermination factor NusG